MYTTYFGFQEKPFTLTPNPRFVYLSKHHKEAFAHLLYGINNHYGFIELVGEVGTGKTTVLRTLMEQLQDKIYRTALIFNPCMTALELLRAINKEFGISATSTSTTKLLESLNRFLLSENSSGRTVVLVIDEAQNLQADVLEQLRLISNLETEDDKLIQIVLVGQPELDVLLQQNNLRQLNQRIAVRYRLSPMSLEETRGYIRHRMQVAGETGGVVFTDQAIRWIYRYSCGVPRTTNILCDRTLLVAYGNERRRVTAVTVLQAILEVMDLGRRRQLMQRGLVAVGLCALLVIGYLTLGRTPTAAVGRAAPAAAKTAQEASPAATAPVAVAAPPAAAALKQDLLSREERYAHLAAFNAVAEAWGAKPLKDPGERFLLPDKLKEAAKRKNLEVATISGKLDDVIRLDLPFLASTRVKGRSGRYVLAVTRISDGVFAISPPLMGTAAIGRADLEALTDGRFYLLWKKPTHAAERISADSKRSQVKALQALLTAAGFPTGRTDGVFTEQTAAALAGFQRSTGLPVARSATPITLASLARFDQKVKAPSLHDTGGVAK